ncbi:MAG: hypothetical protein ACYTAF_04985 [Planctomycetota bacterium]|jgi:hypothetical protein
MGKKFLFVCIIVVVVGGVAAWLQFARPKPAAPTAPRTPVGITVESAGKDAPPGFAVEAHGRCVIISPEIRVQQVRSAVDGVEKRFRDLSGKEPAEEGDPVRIYYFNTKENFTRYFKRRFRRDPESDLGMYLGPPHEVFGSDDVGAGSIAHEMVHVLVMEEWKAVPGWLNEALAQALGAPNICRAIAGSAKRAIRARKWTPLAYTMRHTTTEYRHLKSKCVELVDGTHAYIGELCTGMAFVWWLHETGDLARFYRKYRDTGELEPAVRELSAEGIEPLEREFVQWLRAYE